MCFSFRRSIHQSASSHVCKMVQYSSTILAAFFASVMATCWMLVAFSKLPKAMFWIVVVSCTIWVPPLTLKVNTFLSFSLDKEPVQFGQKLHYFASRTLRQIFSNVVWIISKICLPRFSEARASVKSSPRQMTFIIKELSV